MNFRYKLKNYLVYVSLVFLLFSCSNDDDNTNGLDFTAIDLVTGIDVAENSYSQGYRLGNPNNRMPKNFSSTSIYAVPNPASNNLFLELIQTDELITDVWFVKANAQMIFQEINFEEILNENTYTTSQISQVSINAINDLSTSNLLINLEGYEAGYYKVFINTNESLYWDNIYIDNDDLDITELFESWNQEF